MDLPLLIEECNLGAPSEVVEAIVQVESRRLPYALGVNTRREQAAPRWVRPKSLIEAVMVAVDLVSRGYSVDVGLMQVNSDNLARMGASIAEAFEPCRNIQLGSQIYLDAVAQVNGLGDVFSSPFSQMQGALSLYNTGSTWKGFSNGYVERVTHYIRYGIDPAASTMEVVFTVGADEESPDDMAVDFR